MVTASDVADEEQQKCCGQNPDSLAPCAKEQDGMDDINGPAEEKQGRVPFPYCVSGRDEGNETHVEHVDQ